MNLALRHAQPGQAAGVAAALVQGQQNGFGFVGQQFGVGQRARRDHAHHLALDWPLACGLAHLLANGHRLTELDQLGQVAFDRMKWHAAHGDGHTGRLTAVGQRDVEQGDSFFSVAEKQLVKVPHPVKQQRVRMLGLERQVLAHHRRVIGIFGSHGAGCR